jgi:hypothetical protein
LSTFVDVTDIFAEEGSPFVSVKLSRHHIVSIMIVGDKEAGFKVGLGLVNSREALLTPTPLGKAEAEQLAKEIENRFDVHRGHT